MSTERLNKINLTQILRRIRSNVTFLLSAAGISMVLGFLTTFLNAHALGPEGLGIIALFQAAASLVIGIFSIGSQQPLIRLGRQAIEDGELRRVGVIAGLALMIDTLVSITAGSISLFLIYIIPERVGLDKNVISLAQFYTCVIFFSGTAATTGLLRLINRFNIISTIQVIQALSIFLISLALYILESEVKIYIFSFALAYSFIEVLKIFITLHLSKKYGINISFNFKIIQKAKILQEYIAYAWTTNLTNTIEILRQNFDKLFLGYLFGAEQVGVYSVVRQLAGLVNKLIGPMSTAVFPEVCLFAAKNDFVGAKRLLIWLVLFGFTLGSIAIMFATTFGDKLLSIFFGDVDAAGYYSLIIIMLAMSLNLSSLSFGGFLQAFRSPLKSLQVYGAAFIVYIISAPPLIFFHGIIGASIAQTMFSISIWISGWIMLKRVLP